MSDKILKSSFPMCSVVSREEEKALREKNIPLFKGKLFQVDDYGNEIFVNENTVVIGGAITALEHLFGVPAKFKPASLNKIYNINNTIETDEMSTYVVLFGIGNGGAGLNFNSVIPPDFKQRELPGFIPFQVSETPELGLENADKYYFCRQIDGKYYWYLKEFENAVDIISRRKDSSEEDKDGSEITTEIYNSTYAGLTESYAECNIKIDVTDVVDYYNEIEDFANARYNTIGLFLGQKVEVSEGVYDYVNVRLFSYVTFENVSVKERNEINYIYRIYAAI